MKFVHCCCIFLVLGIFGVNGANITSQEKKEPCFKLQLTEMDFHTLQDTLTQIREFFLRVLEEKKNIKSVEQILGKMEKDFLQAQPQYRLESMHLLTYFEMKKRFNQLDDILAGKIDLNSKEIDTNKNEINIAHLKDKKDYLKNVYHVFKRDLQTIMTGSLSPYAIPHDAPYKPTDSHFRPQDCADLLVAGAKKSGIYEIFPFRCTCSKSVKVYCDMESDGGGWTVFIKRQKTENQLNFSRNWNDYKMGFGSADGEYWLGNEILHSMTISRKYSLMMDAKGAEGRHVYGVWNSFSVDSEENKYKLSVTGFDSTKGDIYDRLAYVNAMKFTTFDVDVDKNGKQNCAVTYKGGFWFNTCYYFNPTGVYGTNEDSGIVLNPWSRVDSKKRVADWLQIKIRPTICSDTVSIASLNTHNCL